MWVPSPNFIKGRSGQKPEIVVIHIMAGTLKGTDAWFQNPDSEASSHYGIGNKGEIHQYVKEEDTAWANGRVVAPTSLVVKKKGGNPNSYSISIENEGMDLSKAPQKHLDTLKALVSEICKRHNIPMDRDHVIGHYEIYSLKPNCPATDKSIIDYLIAEDMKPTKKLAKEYEALIGKDPGDNMNENEQDDFAGKIKDLREKPASVCPPSEDCESVKAENVALKTQVSELEGKIASMEHDAQVGVLFKQVVLETQV